MAAEDMELSSVVSYMWIAHEGGVSGFRILNGVTEELVDEGVVMGDSYRVYLQALADAHEAAKDLLMSDEANELMVLWEQCVKVYLNVNNSTYEDYSFCEELAEQMGSTYFTR